MGEGRELLCNAGGKLTCEFGNKMREGKDRIRGHVLELMRTRDASEVGARRGGGRAIRQRKMKGNKKTLPSDE